MINRVIVKRYSEAFLDFANSTIGPERALRELAELRAVINDYPDFFAILRSLDVSYAEKSGFIDNILKNGFSEEIRQFLKLLLRKGRIDKLLDIAEDARLEYLREIEIEVLVKSAFVLDLELMRTIEKRLRERFQKKIKLFIDLDDSLIGGIQIMVGNTVIDGTIRRRLDELKEKLRTARV